MIALQACDGIALWLCDGRVVRRRSCYSGQFIPREPWASVDVVVSGVEQVGDGIKSFRLLRIHIRQLKFAWWTGPSDASISTLYLVSADVRLATDSPCAIIEPVDPAPAAIHGVLNHALKQHSLFHEFYGTCSVFWAASPLPPTVNIIMPQLETTDEIIKIQTSQLKVTHLSEPKLIRSIRIFIWIHVIWWMMKARPEKNLNYEGFRFPSTFILTLSSEEGEDAEDEIAVLRL
jgi:hypothetical protein